jgi:hypothetical protein
MFIEACAGAAQMKNASQSQNRVDDLTSRLAAGGVERVQILEIPARVLTRTRVTPEMLRRQYRYELTIRDLRGGEYEGKLISLAKSTVVTARAEMPDLRWGIIFYDAGGNPILGLYFDKTGNYGSVDDAPVSFEGELFGWLKSGFSGCFR